MGMDFDFSLNEDTGELEIETTPAKEQQQEGQQSVQQPETQQNVQQPDLSIYENRLSGIEKVLGQLTTYLQAQGQQVTQQQESNSDDEALSDIFVDVNKGKQFINNLVQKVTKQVENKLQVLNPVIAQSTVQNEVMAFGQTHPDLPQYMAGMKYLLSANPNLGLEDLYNMAKNMGLKQASPNVQQSNRNQQGNVTNINRNMPDRIQTENANLNVKREAKTTREALDQAYEEMGLTGS